MTYGWMIDEDLYSFLLFFLFSTQKCPEDVASQDKECTELKNWVTKCRSSVYSFTEIANRIKATD